MAKEESLADTEVRMEREGTLASSEIPTIQRSIHSGLLKMENLPSRRSLRASSEKPIVALAATSRNALHSNDRGAESQTG